ncbi:hypothetical protein B0H21DRAFT_190014 [Amylocystis lapponica]|nr:hypothetical protein B0H21DRAFT_190014 [Amylocystis lapponica]
MPEDFQPNELRLTHKGATHVPTIRPSQPPNNSRNPRGSYRGDGPSPSYMHNKTAPDVLRQHPLISNPSSVSGLPPPSVVPIPIRHELPKKPSHSWDILTVNPPDELSRRFDRRIRHELPTRPQDLGVNERPLKRPRLDIPPSSTSNQYDTVTHINATAISAPPTRYPEIASKTAGTPSQPSETPDFLDIVISLPIECRRGKPYNKRNRHTWIEAQIEHLEAERGVKLILWDINGPNVRFRCSAAVRPPGDQQVSQPAEANSSLVHLQLGDNSSYEAVEEKSFTHIRSSPPVLVQDGKSVHLRLAVIAFNTPETSAAPIRFPRWRLR